MAEKMTIIQFLVFIVGAFNLLYCLTLLEEKKEAREIYRSILMKVDIAVKLLDDLKLNDANNGNDLFNSRLILVEKLVAELTAEASKGTNNPVVIEGENYYQQKPLL